MTDPKKPSPQPAEEPQKTHVPHDLYPQVTAIILALTRERWAYQTWWENGARHVEAMNGDHRLTITFRGRKTTAHHGDQEIDPKTIKQFLETHTARKPR